MAQAELAIPYMVPMDPTPLHGRELAEQFARGHELATGRRAGSKRFLENALGIICVENGAGDAIIQYNWGNIMANLATWTGPFWLHPVPQEGQPLFFRAYPDHDQGSAAWWRLMYGRRHRQALEFAALGKPVEMVRSLYRSGYVVGGPERRYEESAANWAEAFRRRGFFAELGPYRADFAGGVGLALGMVGIVTVGVIHGE